jgi:dTDP-4-dehydrorhamnose 3,5-epimerase
MPLRFKETPIAGLMLISVHRATDDRGYFLKYFEKRAFLERGLPVDFSDLCEIMSVKGTLRGMHYQSNPSQGRLIQVISGSVFNVALDLREKSSSFGMYECLTLSKGMAVFVPENFANGLLALEDNTITTCHFTGAYVAENCGGILWNDKELNIPWPVDTLGTPLIISEKDRNLQTFARYREKKICLNQ